MATNPYFNEFVLTKCNVLNVFPSNWVDVIKLRDKEIDGRRYILLRFELHNSGYNFLSVVGAANGTIVRLGVEGEGGKKDFEEHCREKDMVNALSIVQEHRQRVSLFR